MRKVFCDECSEEIEEEDTNSTAVMLVIEDEQEENSEELTFCSQKCCGKWMINKAKKFGVYDK